MLFRSIYDERQLQIYGEIYKHGFFVTAITLGLNAIVSHFGIVWASGFSQNILMLMFISTFMCIEMIIRNVFFGKTTKPVIILIAIGGFAGFIISFTINVITGHNAEPAAHHTGFIADGMLTDLGSMVVTLAMAALIVLAGLIKHIHNKAKEKN